MKKYLFFILGLCISGFAASGQKIHITDPGNVWKVGFVGYANSDLYYHMTYSYGADTVWNGNTYRRVVSSSQYIPIGPINGTSGFPPYPNAIREDTLTGMVYSLQYGDSIERLFFNYNLNAGDTITFNFYNSTPIKDSVTAIDSVQINGVYNKIFRLASLPTYSYANFTFIEGVGSLHYPFYHLMPGCFEGSTTLLCFAQDTVYPNFSVSYTGNTDCFIYTPVGGSFSNAATCIDEELAGVSGINKSADLFVSPNPFFNTIHVNNMSGKTMVCICDITGREVYGASLNANDNEIYVPDLQKGMYILRLTDIDNNIYNFKIVKE